MNQVRSPLWPLIVAAVFALPISSAAFEVATPTLQSTETAIEILRQGGNATDAAVAASFVLNVTEPYDFGIGGGGFYLAARGGETWFWDSRETGPASALEKMFLDADGKPIPYEPDRITGPNPVGVPGFVRGLHEAHKKLGLLPWARLLEPAIRLAREGFPISQYFVKLLDMEWGRISRFPTTAALFGNGEGGHLELGQVLRQPQLSRTLEAIASNGADAFYRGSLAKAWTAEAATLGVRITPADLAAYQVKQREPVHFKVFGLDAVTAGPPSAAGLMVAASLRFLEHYYRDHEPPAPNSAARVIVTTETLAFFQALRNTTIADPPYGKLDPQKFLGSAEERKAWSDLEKKIAERRDRIETRVTKAASPMDEQQALGRHTGRSSTAHMSIVDDRGMAVSFTGTIEQWFGSGIVVPGSGFLLNNELSDFSPQPGDVNSPAPGKRPRSNMSPTLLFDGKQLIGAVGAAGGPYIPTEIVLLLENYFTFKMNLREAMSYGRFHPEDGALELEKGFPLKTVSQLKDAGYQVKVTDIEAVAQGVMRRSKHDQWEAASDVRASGLGLVLAPQPSRKKAARN